MIGLGKHDKELSDFIKCGLHINTEVSSLLNVNNITRRLKWKKPFDLVNSENTKWFRGSNLVIIYVAY
jgi:hypothetical protein